MKNEKVRWVKIREFWVKQFVIRMDHRSCIQAIEIGREEKKKKRWNIAVNIFEELLDDMRW